MNRLQAANAVTIAAIFWLVTVRPVPAEFTFLGPTPYSSAADSPFDLSGLGSTFFLEDFEDWSVNTPGVLGYGSIGLFRSVDADDGALDGMDSGGHSAGVTVGDCVGTPGANEICSAFVGFEFNESELGYLPTAAGFVITSSAGGPDSQLIVYDPSGELIFNFSLENIISDPELATDDVFVGITNPQGIANLSLSETIVFQSNRASPRLAFVDHLQYGLLIPEPSAISIAGASALVLILPLRRLGCALITTDIHPRCRR